MPDSLLGSLAWGAMLLLGAFFLFTAATTAAIEGSIVMGLGVVVGGLLLYWTWMYRRETESAAETVEKVGEEASGFFGGLVGWFTAAITSLAFVLITISGQLMDTVDVLIQFVSTAPIASGTLGIAGVLALLDWNGTVGLQFEEWVVVGVALLFGGVLLRRYLYGEVET